MSLQITKNVTYVGKIDWGLRKFHGEQLTTDKGSSYNSYLIRDKKVALIDTVYAPFAQEFMEKLEREVGINNIDYMIALHAEPDHSSTLREIVAMRPDLPIYCTEKGIKSLKGYYHKDWNCVPVKTGDTLNLGDATLTFIEAAMLHWPDQMMVYYDKDQILFSSDPFGEHYSSEYMFDTHEDLSILTYEAIKYYANIVAPYSKQVLQKLAELEQLNLPIKMIAPAHGVVWTNPNYIIDKYAQWANTYQENRITIVYDTMYDSTRKMGEAIAEGITSKYPEINVRLFNAATADISDINTEVFRSKGILIGSPTYNNGILNSVAGLLEEIKGFRLENKKAATFGSYGWFSAATKSIAKMLVDAKFELCTPDSIICNWNPTGEDLSQCREFGAMFADFCEK